eukprot:TRINITY_DN1380_c0_g1_i1.p1 TRINITY_DN1380_c0_g1~~TRINITY_DN1380_c0_g1_i1.p1  ORF type:complete len:140 (+),score=28.42 TRINITY_DN1380_c0_g1_i1:27-422(+)
MKATVGFIVIFIALLSFVGVSRAGNCDVNLYCNFFYKNPPRLGTKESCQSLCWSDYNARKLAHDDPGAICYCGYGKKCNPFNDGIVCLKYKNVGCMSPGDLSNCGWYRTGMDGRMCLRIPPVKNCNGTRIN